MSLRLTREPGSVNPLDGSRPGWVSEPDSKEFEVACSDRLKELEGTARSRAADREVRVARPYNPHASHSTTLSKINALPHDR